MGSSVVDRSSMHHPMFTQTKLIPNLFKYNLINLLSLCGNLHAPSLALAQFGLNESKSQTYCFAHEGRILLAGSQRNPFLNCVEFKRSFTFSDKTGNLNQNGKA